MHGRYRANVCVILRNRFRFILDLCLGRFKLTWCQLDYGNLLVQQKP